MIFFSLKMNFFKFNVKKFNKFMQLNKIEKKMLNVPSHNYLKLKYKKNVFVIIMNSS